MISSLTEERIRTPTSSSIPLLLSKESAIRLFQKRTGTTTSTTPSFLLSPTSTESRHRRDHHSHNNKYHHQLHVQCPRRRYQRPSQRKTHEDENKEELWRRFVPRSLSLAGCDEKERPCMKKTTTTARVSGAMLDCSILRPYRQLSSEYLVSLGEETEDGSADTTDNNNNNDNKDIKVSDCDFDSDCEGYCEKYCDSDCDDPTNATNSVVPLPVVDATIATVFPLPPPPPLWPPSLESTSLEVEDGRPYIHKDQFLKKKKGTKYKSYYVKEIKIDGRCRYRNTI